MCRNNTRLCVTEERINPRAMKARRIAIEVNKIKARVGALSLEAIEDEDFDIVAKLNTANEALTVAYEALGGKKR